MTGQAAGSRDTATPSPLATENPAEIYSSPEKSAVIQRSGRIVNRIPG